jgi:hypothetical protein
MHNLLPNLLGDGKLRFRPLRLWRLPETMRENPAIPNAKTRHTDHSLSTLRAVLAPPLECPERWPFSFEQSIIVHLLLAAMGQMQEVSQQMSPISLVNTQKKIPRRHTAIRTNRVFDGAHAALGDNTTAIVHRHHLV